MTSAMLGNRVRQRKLTPPPPPSYGKPKTCASLIGLSDRAASTTVLRDAIAKFDWVNWGIYRASSSLRTTLEASIAYCKAINPDQIHSNYSIAYEAGGQGGEIASITRSGTTVTVTTDQTRESTVVAGGTVLIASSRVVAYNGTWTVTGVGTSSFTFTASGAAATAVNDTSARDAYYVAGNSVQKDLVKWLGDNNAWMRNLGTTVPRTSWTTAFGKVDMNLTSWGPTDANGDRWPQFKAKDDAAQIFSQVAGLDAQYLDNYTDPRDDVVNDALYPGQRGKADWKRSGVLQNRTDADILASHRAGYASVASTARALSVNRAKSPNLWIMGNVDSTFSGTGWENTIEAAYLERVTDLGTITTILARHDMVKARLLSPQRIVMATSSSSVTDYKAFRYGLCIALLRPNAWHMHSASNYDNTTWYNEWDAPLGLPVDAEPNAAWTGSVWRMRFQNGWALVNEGGSSAVLDLSAYGLRFLGASDFTTAVQDGAVNTGAAVGSLTLPAGDGIVLLYA